MTGAKIRARIRIGLAQTTTGLSPERNAAHLAQAIGELAEQGADAVFLPEMCGLLDRDGRRLRAAARTEAEDPVLATLRRAAADGRVVVAVGSLAIRTADSERLSNRSFVLGADGRILARYDKMHLFDVELPNGERYRESAGFRAGEGAQLVDLPFGRLGLAICYDLRFPELHAALARAGAQLIAQPASFTVPTGTAHWHVLLRARAIETGCFVVAAAQSGLHEDGRATYGHSLVVNPWGEVLLDMGEGAGTAIVDLDLAEVEAARARIPSLRHARAIGRPALSGTMADTMAGAMTDTTP